MPRSTFYAGQTLATALFALVASCAAAQAPGSLKKGDTITGTAIVVDGHTLDIRSNRLVIWGIDTPERGAWCYRSGRRWKPMDDAKAALSRCVEEKAVTCRVQNVEKDWFRRLHVSECWTEDGQDLGSCMVRGGWATDYACYTDGYYRDIESEARNKGIGLWQCDNGPPTRRWGRQGPNVACETPVYRPAGPGPK